MYYNECLCRIYIVLGTIETMLRITLKLFTG